MNHRTVKIGGSCMHRNGYLLVYIYSSIRSALSVDLLAAYSMQRNSLDYTHQVVDSKL